jgi:hypothetical protein
MEDNYTSFKIHSNYYAGILDVIEDLPEAERNSILAEYFLAFHEYGNTRKIPEFKNKIAQGFFNAILYSVDKSFEKNDNYQASQDIGSVGGKQKAINAKIRAAEKKYQEAEKKLDELEAKAKAKAEQAEKLNTVEPEATEVEDNQPITNRDSLKTQKEQTVSSSHQLQKTQQPPKPQQVQKMHELDWQCVAGLELTEQQQQEALRIRKANNTSKKTRTFTQASLKQFLTQVKYSVDAGISIDEVLEVWEGKQWVTWTHAYYAKEIASDIKAQSQTAKDLKSVQSSQEDVQDNDWDNFVITPLVKSMVEDTIKEKIEQSKKGGN